MTEEPGQMPDRKKRATGAAEMARGLIAPVEEEIIDLLQVLVRTDSVSVPPDGHEADAQQALHQALRSHDIESELYDTDFLEKSGHPLVRTQRHYAGRPNLIARIPGTGGGKSLLFSGHIDTVTAPGKWSVDPFSGEIREGRLYGRGAWDMKGGIAAHFGVLMALQKAGMRLAGDVLGESVVDEEWAGGGGTLAARLRGITADASVITECTNLEVLRASRGGYFFDIIARAGDPSAYFTKDEVVSPAIPMGRILAWVDQWQKRRRGIETGQVYKDFSDPAPVQVLALEANRFDPGTPWSTPTEAKLRLYFQYLPHEDVPGEIRMLRQSFDEFCANDPFFKRFTPEWRALVEEPLLGHELPADHPFTECLAAAADAALGEKTPVTASEWPCDAFINQREFGIPTLLLGPRGAGAHNVDEYVEVDSVIATSCVLLTAAILWCGVDS